MGGRELMYMDSCLAQVLFCSWDRPPQEDISDMLFPPPSGQCWPRCPG